MVETQKCSEPLGGGLSHRAEDGDWLPEQWDGLISLVVVVLLTVSL